MQQPQVGDTVIASWPGEGWQKFTIKDIKEDKDGIMCAVFGKDGTVGAASIGDLYLSYTNEWWAISLCSSGIELLECYGRAKEEAGHLTGAPRNADVKDFLVFQNWKKLADRLYEKLAELLVQPRQ